MQGTRETHEGQDSKGGVQWPASDTCHMYNSVHDTRHTCTMCIQGATYRRAGETWKGTCKHENNRVETCVLRHGTQVLGHLEEQKNMAAMPKLGLSFKLLVAFFPPGLHLPVRRMPLRLPSQGGRFQFAMDLDFRCLPSS